LKYWLIKLNYRQFNTPPFASLLSTGLRGYTTCFPKFTWLLPLKITSTQRRQLLESGRKYAAKASGWGLIASVLPSQTAKAFCIGKKNSLIIEYAERTTEFLAPQIGQERVAKLLPIELRTEQAATYMHQRQRFALEAVIHKSIALK
jgi:hypothetical protein